MWRFNFITEQLMIQEWKSILQANSKYHAEGHKSMLHKTRKTNNRKKMWTSWRLKTHERHEFLVHLRISVQFWTQAGREKMCILLQGNRNKFGPNNNLVLYAKLSKFESHLCQTVKKWKYLRRQQVMYLWTLVCKGQSCLCVSIARSSRAVHLIVEVLPGLV